MKILITTDLFTTSTNGVVTSVRNLYEELVQKGHDVRILTLSGDRDSYKKGHVYYIKSIPIGFIYPDVRMPLSYRSGLIQELIDWKPEVVHSQCEFFSFQFANRIAKLTGAPIVHTYHTLYEQYVTYVMPSKYFGQKMVGKLSKMRLKNVKKVIAPTSKVENALKEYGIRADIQVVPSGISLEQHHYRMSEEERSGRKEKLGIPENHKILLNLGRLGTEKNLSELLEYFSKTLQYDSMLTFLIVGDGPDKINLEKQARDLGICDHVVFTGMVAPEEVQQYYQLADVFVNASTSETQGLTYIEAAANGLPLLCRKDPCLKEVIKNGINGYEYTNLAEFTGNLNYILNNPVWRSHASAESEKIAESFGKEQFGESMEEIYSEVAG